MNLRDKFGPRLNPTNPATLARRPPGLVPYEEALRVPRAGPAPAQPGAVPTRVPMVRVGALPGVDYPTADSIAFDQLGDGDIAAGATASLLTIQLQKNKRFRWAGIGFGSDDPTALRFLSWSIFVTPPGANTPSYVTMPAPVGSIAQLSPMFLLYGNEERLQVFATSSAVLVTYHFIVRAQGWFFEPAQEGE